MFDVSKFGDDIFEHIANMRFTKGEKVILECAYYLNDEDFNDEQYFKLALYFAENNGLNN